MGLGFKVRGYAEEYGKQGFKESHSHKKGRLGYTQKSFRRSFATGNGSPN